jgi:cell shape-determining protein MreD
MRVLPLILLGFVAIGLQRGLDALMTVGPAQADLVMIAAAFIATCLPKAAGGAIAAGLLGLAYDLSGAGPIGLYAASLGLGGLAASSLQANRWPRLLGAMLAGITVSALVAWGLSMLRDMLSADPIPAGMTFRGMIGTILLTSLLAAPVSAPLWKWRRHFVIEPPRF